MVIKDIKDIRSGLVQSFRYAPINTGSVGGDTILRLCKSGFIDSDMAAIAKYLYKFRCAPISYIVRDLNIADQKKCQDKLNKLVAKRVFNSFVLSETRDEYSEDGLVFYTIDYGALTLLRAIEEDDNIENWKATDVIMTGLKVKKCLMLLDFYHKIRNKIEYLDPYHLYLTYGARLRTKAELKLKDGEAINGHTGKFVVEIICEDDLYEGSGTEINSKLTTYEQLICTDGWSYCGFDNPPTLLILGDSQKSLSRIKSNMEGSKIKDVDYIIVNF